jgi:hypothetical protein
LRHRALLSGRAHFPVIGFGYSHFRLRRGSDFQILVLSYLEMQNSPVSERTENNEEWEASKQTSDSFPIPFCHRDHPHINEINTILMNSIKINENINVLMNSMKNRDRLCGLVVRIPGYRSRGPGSITGTPRFVRSGGSGTGSTQPLEYNSGAT